MKLNQESVFLKSKLVTVLNKLVKFGVDTKLCDRKKIKKLWKRNKWYNLFKSTQSVQNLLQKETPKLV